MMIRYIFLYGYGPNRIAAYADLEKEIQDAQDNYGQSLAPTSGPICTEDGSEYMVVQQFLYFKD